MDPTPPSPLPRRSRQAIGSFIFSLVAALLLVFVVTDQILTYAIPVIPDSPALGYASIIAYVSIYICLARGIDLGTTTLGEMKVRPGERREKAWAISGILLGSITLLLMLFLTVVFILPRW